MEVRVRTEAGVLSLEADTLDVARLVASCSGFHLDIEPMGSAPVKLTATHHRSGAVIRANGASVIKAAEKLISLLTNEVNGG